MRSRTGRERRKLRRGNGRGKGMKRRRRRSRRRRRRRRRRRKLNKAVDENSSLSYTGRHLPYGIIQCYLPPVTSERAPPYPQPESWYSIYLSRRDGRLS